MRTRRIATSLASLMLLLAGVAPAADIDWSTIDGGGGHSAGGNFELKGTIGQPDAGMVMAGGDFSLAGGFWPGGDVVGPIQPGDCDGDGDIDLADFDGFEDCLLGPDGGLGLDCDCFDLDSDGDSDLADYATFQANFTGS
jgi:hypothetical protein